MNNVSENRVAYKVERYKNCLNNGEPSSKAKYDTWAIVKSTMRELKRK